ncbi:MAG: ABC transporter permease subunit [Bacteroidetes bacterium]|nr:ABC transporter permease subunit [Bacteroidota bacterium]
MLKLLNLEWQKQRKHRIFHVLIGMYVLLLPTTILPVKSIPELPPPINSPDALFQFPTVFTYIGYAGNWLSFFFLGFFAVLLATQEYSYRTMRQNIITGLSRNELFKSKISFLITLCLGATLYYFLVCLFYGFTHTDNYYLSTITKNIDYIPRYFLMCLGYSSFGFLIGLLIRRTGIALFLYLAYVMFIELILRWLIHMKIFANKSMHFYPMNAIEDLAPVPFAEVAETFRDENGFGFFLTPTEAMIASSIYIVLFIFFAQRLMLKRDL